MKKYLYLVVASMALASCVDSTTASSTQAHDETVASNDGTGAYQSTGDASLLDITLPSNIDNQKVEYDYMTVYFNASLRIPNCVAYELTNTQVAMANSPDAEKRDNYDFNCDNDVDGCPDWWEYKNSGYDRGHMAPAMDMRWDKKAMKQCFYMTNMCPQRHDLNDGEWRHMEEAIHNWGAENERLVIFTGPIVDDNPKMTGKNHDIAVPGQFFKVVYAPASNKAIAFVMGNHKMERSWTNYATTIDEVERLTGIDFLAALPDDVEQTVESKHNIKQWPEYTPRR